MSKNFYTNILEKDVINEKTWITIGSLLLLAKRVLGTSRARCRPLAEAKRADNVLEFSLQPQNNAGPDIFVVTHDYQALLRNQLLTWKIISRGRQFREFNDMWARLLSPLHTKASAVCSLAVVPHASGSYGIRRVFPCKSAIGSEACRAGLIKCDPIAKSRRPFPFAARDVYGSNNDVAGNGELGLVRLLGMRTDVELLLPSLFHHFIPSLPSDRAHSSRQSTYCHPPGPFCNTRMRKKRDMEKFLEFSCDWPVPPQPHVSHVQGCSHQLPTKDPPNPFSLCALVYSATAGSRAVGTRSGGYLSRRATGAFKPGVKPGVKKKCPQTAGSVQTTRRRVSGGGVCEHDRSLMKPSAAASARTAPPPFPPTSTSPAAITRALGKRARSGSKIAVYDIPFRCFAGVWNRISGLFASSTFSPGDYIGEFVSCRLSAIRRFFRRLCAIRPSYIPFNPFSSPRYVSIFCFDSARPYTLLPNESWLRQTQLLQLFAALRLLHPQRKHILVKALHDKESVALSKLIAPVTDYKYRLKDSLGLDLHHSVSMADVVQSSLVSPLDRSPRLFCATTLLSGGSSLESSSSVRATKVWGRRPILPRVKRSTFESRLNVHLHAHCLFFRHTPIIPKELYVVFLSLVVFTTVHTIPTAENSAHTTKQIILPTDHVCCESCRIMPLVTGSSRGSPVPPAPSSRRCSILNSITLIGSQDFAVERRKIYKGYTGSRYKCAIAAKSKGAQGCPQG
ncbi:hypothetical protein PR048_024541 [Dryococelus australis]|uniref:Uncharacterized protein n=1 Tax=Dryococelus australis TaxID=614101 RepID=A0ABQ9GNU7_9NEOP|nr:hypothetical protein PR048_024541 [Dryococelus australis]